MTTTRTPFVWDTVLQTESGEMVEREFTAHWSPSRDFITAESVAKASAAQEYAARGGDRAHAPRVAGLTAVLREG